MVNLGVHLYPAFIFHTRRHLNKTTLVSNVPDIRGIKDTDIIGFQETRQEIEKKERWPILGRVKLFHSLLLFAAGKKKYLSVEQM